MISRPSSLVAALALWAACSFDPSGFGGGGGSDIGGDRGDGGNGSGGSDGDQGIDAAVASDGAADCDPSCPGFCDQDGTCNIVCGGSGGGGELLPEGGGGPPPCDAVACPAGMPCHVLCIGRDACDQTIDCTESTSCVIDCTDERTCASQITCGSGSCEVHCDGRDSCGGGVECQSSCFCDVSCQGESSCGQQTTCPPGCDNDPDCKTTGAGCASSC